MSILDIDTQAALDAYNGSNHNFRDWLDRAADRQLVWLLAAIRFWDGSRLRMLEAELDRRLAAQEAA